MKHFTLLKTLLLLCAMTCSMGVWAEADDVLKTYDTASSTFLTGYNRQVGDNFVFYGQKGYYGANNATNHGNFKPTAVDLPVVKAQNASATTSTTGLYYLYNTEAVSNVGAVKVSFTANSGSSTVNAYVVTSSTAAANGSATWSKVTLASESTSAQGANVATASTYTFKLNETVTSAKYYGIVFVTSSYWRATNLKVELIEGETKTLSSIAVQTAPSKTIYTEGEFFNPAGLVITKTFEDASTENVAYASDAASFTFAPSLTTALVPSNTSVQITVGGKTTTQAITVNTIPTHTAHFSVNGIVDANNDCTVKEGVAIEFPSAPSDINGKKFVGWAENSIDGTTNSEPSLVESMNMGNKDITFYAIFADTEVGEDIPTTFYYEPFAGAAHSAGFASDNVAATQSMFYDKSATVWSHYTDTKAPSTTSYATNLDGSSMSNGIKIYKQINNSTATILEVKGIDIRKAKNLNVSLYNRRTYNNATLIVEYKIDDDENYTATGGTIAYNSTNDKWKFTDGLSISETGTTLDLKISVKVTGTTNRIMLIDDVKVYGDIAGITYSNYCTTVAIPASVNVTIGAAGYATLVAPYALDFTDNAITAYSVEADVDNSVVHMTAVEKVPAGKAIVVKGSTGEVATVASADDFATDLEASATDIAYDDVYTYYYLGVDNGTVGFRPLATGGSIAAGKCYFKVANTSGAKFLAISFDDEVSGINNVNANANNNAVYNLAGQRVNANVKGIVIINGKKYLNK